MHCVSDSSCACITAQLHSCATAMLWDGITESLKCRTLNHCMAACPPIGLLGSRVTVPLHRLGAARLNASSLREWVADPLPHLVYELLCHCVPVSLCHCTTWPLLDGTLLHCVNGSQNHFSTPATNYCVTVSLSLRLSAWQSLTAYMPMFLQSHQHNSTIRH